MRLKLYCDVKENNKKLSNFDKNKEAFFSRLMLTVNSS